MKSLFICLFICFYHLSGFPQYNLVPNSSFEDSVVCPNLNNDAPTPSPWYIPSNLKGYYYYNSCSSEFYWNVPYNSVYSDTNFQYAKSGNGYAALDVMFDGGFTPNSRTYVQVKLKESLQNNQCYYCSFWVNLPNPDNRSTNNIALWLTKTAVYSDTIANPFGLALIPANPQIYNYGNPVITDTMNWVKVSGIFIAQGGEQYITIGNFKNDLNTIVKTVNTGGPNIVSYFVDDVSITPLDSLPLQADAGADRTIISGDSTFIGSLTNGLTNVTWYNSSGAVINTVALGFYVTPAGNTFYVLKQTVCGYTSRDTVYINVQPMPVHLISFTAIRQQNIIKLHWTAEAEQNFDRYEIERSDDGKHFSKRGIVKARNERAYNYTDIEQTPLTTASSLFTSAHYSLLISHYTIA